MYSYKERANKNNFSQTNDYYIPKDFTQGLLS